MKARLVPVYFKSGRDDDFNSQANRLAGLLAEEAEILEPVALGSTLPEAEAVVFPQLLGDAYSQTRELNEITLPLLIITSEFGTVSMWDWEIASYLRSVGIETIAPYNLEQTKKMCKGLAVKRELAQAKFLVFQDNPGDGFQADIFKRFRLNVKVSKSTTIRRTSVATGVSSHDSLHERHKSLAEHTSSCVTVVNQDVTISTSSQNSLPAIVIHLFHEARFHDLHGTASNVPSGFTCIAKQIVD